jgi:hypothetical protein
MVTRVRIFSISLLQPLSHCELSFPILLQRTAFYSTKVKFVLWLYGGGGGWSIPRPGCFAPGNDTVPIVQEAGWGPGPVWTSTEISTPTGIRSSDRPGRSESLYRLRYPGHFIVYSTNPLIRTLVILIDNYADRLGPSGKFVENSTKLTCLEITGYWIKYSTVLWLVELQIRRVRKV